MWQGGLSVKIMRSAKVAEPFEMLFGVLTQEGPRNHALDGV